VGDRGEADRQGPRVPGGQTAAAPAVAALVVALALAACSRGAPAGCRAASPGGRREVLYVAEEGAVEAFALDACGGLRRIGAVPAAGTPDGLAPSPDGRFVYALDGDGRVQGFRVGQGGALVALAAPAVPAGRGAQAAAFSPSGRHLYVADAEADAISCYARDPATGALAPLRPASVPTGDGSTPWALAVAPSGRYLYVVERGADAVVRYDIRPATGTLVPATRGSTASDGIYPRSIVLSSDGRYAYVANESDTIAEFSVRDDGSLVPLPDSPLTLAGEIPWQIVLAPSGRYAYVVNQGGFVSTR
jgi:6-phosphogluconolactonase (cycloisomerase 2 family)